MLEALLQQDTSSSAGQIAGTAQPSFAPDRRGCINASTNRGPHALRRFLQILRAKRVDIALEPECDLDPAAVAHDIAETLHRSGMIRKTDIDDMAKSVHHVISPTKP